MEQILTSEERSILGAILESAQRVVVTCHVNPDGDAIGSVTAVLLLMKRLGKDAVGIVPNNYPDNLRWMQGAPELIVCSKSKEEAEQQISNADVIFCLDYNGPERVNLCLILSNRVRLVKL